MSTATWALAWLRNAACAWLRDSLQVSWMYYTTFMHTMRREWAGIDRLRLDKFMLLIRKFVSAVLCQLRAHGW